MPITNLIRDNWCRFQGELFPEIQDAVGPLLKNHQRLVMALGIICPEDFTLSSTLYKKRSRSGPKNSVCGDLHQSLLNEQNVPSEIPNILLSLSAELQPYPNFVIGTNGLKPDDQCICCCDCSVV